MSILAVALAGLLSGIPTIILLAALVIEAGYPTMGDDDCIVIEDMAPVKPMHPGYMGTERLLDAPLPMAADGLCLYHCILCLLYTSPSPRDGLLSRMPSSA